MTQAMVLAGVLAICAVSGALLALRPRWTHGPDEPTGSYTPPPAPAPTRPPASPAARPVPAVTPVKPSQPLPVQVAAAPPQAAVPVPTPARRTRNSGLHRFPQPVGPSTTSTRAASR